MNETTNVEDENHSFPWFETEAAAFIGAPPPAIALGLPERVIQRIRRRAKPDRLLESFIFGFFRSGVRVALYLACGYAAKVVFGIGHLSLSLR
jgi:hypothetical protein